MISGHDFQPIGHRPSVCPTVAEPDDGALLPLLSDRVERRFTRLTGLTAVTTLMNAPGGSDDKDPAENPGHPACAELARSDYCRESWQLHLTELAQRPQTHWHRCDGNRLCGVVPVVCQGRCLAACKLACAGTLAVDDFLNNVEILDVLVKDFVTDEAGFLGRLFPPDRVVGELVKAPSSQGDAKPVAPVSHPTVVKTLQYIEEHLSDPRLTMGRIACELGVHRAHLSELFANAVGERATCFITRRRVELAQNLLATTDWQIKKIAYETGHANPNWFSCVFRSATGLKPVTYRKQSRRSSHVA